MTTVDFQNLARRRKRRRIPRLHDRSFRRHGRARRGARHSGAPGERPGLPLELQSGQVRLVFGGSKRHAEADVHDAHERSAARPAGHDRADESVPAREGFDHRCVVEFRGEKTDQEIQTAPARCAPMGPGGWSRRISIGCRNSGNASNAFFARMSATCCAIIRSTTSSSARAFWFTPPRSRCIRSTPKIGSRNCARRRASAFATSRSAARKFARRTFTSPTTRSFR